MQKRHFRTIILTGGLLLVVALIATKCSVSIFLATERPAAENAANDHPGLKDSPIEDPSREHPASDSPATGDADPLGPVPKRDWEEITQDDTHIYIGDFDNNYGSRRNLRILKFTKESILAGSPRMQQIRFTYSDQHDLTSPGSNHTDFDCEAFPVRGDSIFLFTKQWTSQQTSVYLLPNRPGDKMAQLQQTYDVQGLVTGSVYLEDMDLLVFTGYSSDMAPFLYLFYDFEGVDFFGGNRRKVGLDLPGNFMGRGHQVEAVTTRDGLTYYITNEHFSISVLSFPQQIHRLDLSGLLGHYVATRSGSQ